MNCDSNGFFSVLFLSFCQVCNTIVCDSSVLALYARVEFVVVGKRMCNYFELIDFFPNCREAAQVSFFFCSGQYDTANILWYVQVAVLKNKQECPQELPHSGSCILPYRIRRHFKLIRILSKRPWFKFIFTHSDLIDGLYARSFCRKKSKLA
jgi:hypothetical protein